MVYGFGISYNIKNYRATIGGPYAGRVHGTAFNDAEAIVGEKFAVLGMCGTSPWVFKLRCFEWIRNYIGIATGSLTNSTNAVIVPGSDFSHA